MFQAYNFTAKFGLSVSPKENPTEEILSIPKKILRIGLHTWLLSLASNTWSTGFKSEVLSNGDARKSKHGKPALKRLLSE